MEEQERSSSLLTGARDDQLPAFVLKRVSLARQNAPAAFTRRTGRTFFCFDKLFLEAAITLERKDASFLPDADRS